MQRILTNRGAVITALVGLSLVASEVHSQAAADPSDAEILDVLVPDLNGVRLLTMQDLTEDQIDNIGNTPEVGRRFEGDFNADGQPELALFGSSTEGTFVLLATKDEVMWERSGLLQHTRPFVVGRLDRDVLRVFFCTGCDSGMRVVWAGNGYELAPFPPKGVPE
jgi:hypothetical protein